MDVNCLGMQLVLVHGFTQSSSMWEALIPCLPDRVDGSRVRVSTPEVPHGLSFADTAAAILRQCGRAVYVGYSMGARLCLRSAVDNPGLVRALVMVSGSPGLRDAEERASRRRADEDLARRIERDGVERFISWWLSTPMFETLGDERAQAVERVRSNSVERLTHQIRQLGQGAQEPLWDAIAGLSVPVALVTGRADVRYDKVAQDMLRELGETERSRGAVHVRVAGGHSVPLEQPAALGRALGGLLDHYLKHGSFS